MEEITQASQPQKPKLSKEERSKVMREAATRRWANARKAAAAAKTSKAKAAPKAPQPKRPAAPREFSSALKTAERRLASAILERAKAAATYAVLSAEIPSLQRLIVALRNPLGAMPGYAVEPSVSLEQIVGDQPLQYQNPPRPAPSPMPIKMQHPVTTASRAMGGAVGVELEEGEDEDKFLKESGVAGGEWR